AFEVDIPCSMLFEYMLKLFYFDLTISMICCHVSLFKASKGLPSPMTPYPTIMPNNRATIHKIGMTMRRSQIGNMRRMVRLLAFFSSFSRFFCSCRVRFSESSFFFDGAGSLVFPVCFERSCGLEAVFFFLRDAPSLDFFFVNVLN